MSPGFPCCCPVPNGCCEFLDDETPSQMKATVSGLTNDGCNNCDDDNQAWTFNHQHGEWWWGNIDGSCMKSVAAWLSCLEGGGPIYWIETIFEMFDETFLRGGSNIWTKSVVQDFPPDCLTFNETLTFGSGDSIECDLLSGNNVILETVV